MTPTRSSRRYMYLKGLGLRSSQTDKPAVTLAPSANQAVNGYPYPNQGAPVAYDLFQRMLGSPDQGTTLPSN